MEWGGGGEVRRMEDVEDRKKTVQVHLLSLVQTAQL